MEQEKYGVVVFGAGKIGRVVAQFFASHDAYCVSLVDINRDALARASKDFPQITTISIAEGNVLEYERALQQADVAFSCLPFDANPLIATAAKRVGAHYVDLTEDIESTAAVMQIYGDTNLVAIPQCGLAPGLINILGVHVMGKLDEVETLEMKVGALSQHPSNDLDYHITWSVHGLINEYIKPGTALRDGEIVSTTPLEELRHVIVNGREYESFNTSGGVADLPQRCKGKVKNMDYQTIRYRGHRDSLKLLLETLGFKHDSHKLEERFEQYLGTTDQDVVVIHVKAAGKKDGKYHVETIGQHIYPQQINGIHRTAIAITTAGTACGVVELLRQGNIGQRGGVLSQADIPYDKLLETPFLDAYRKQIT
ncbi:saccharopine dehydrogenase NADP-binding domain-containing protein [Candidatus Woesearchaeota archaeon]|nr:saccharopine dehydrogenase NADP-binding domain-containing protein [Candidatus Woesearchaeota archaeon]